MKTSIKKRYSLLPFNFQLFGNDCYLISNDGGEYDFLSKNDFKSLVDGVFSDQNKLRNLKSKNFVSFDNIDLSVNMLATKYRTRKGYLRNFTALHMMVITLRCNHKCKYCQVSSCNKDDFHCDMSPQTAKRILDYVFRSPSKEIKIEFQGGEPLLNWPTISETILTAIEMNKKFNKDISFVLCTNLTLIKKCQLEFLKKYNVAISTSLDGARQIHNENRVMFGNRNSYDLFVEKLSLTREVMGHDSVSALLTITRDSLDRLPEVIDAYMKNGFNGIFFRSLSPYGYAVINEKEIGYEMYEFVQAFERGLDYIISLNLQGRRFVEYYTQLLLTRILTPFSTGFVDLQSPSGAGISGAIYDHDGSVYAADEGRMLSRMGDDKFLMGNVFKDSYLEIFNGEVITEIAEKSCLQVLPQCSSCVYQSYCGADPIRSYLETGDLMGCRSTGNFCKKQKGVFDMLFRKIQSSDQDVMNVFWDWITNY